MSARALVARMLSFAHEGGRKKVAYRLFDPIYSKTDRITHSEKFRINS